MDVAIYDDYSKKPACVVPVGCCGQRLNVEIVTLVVIIRFSLSRTLVSVPMLRVGADHYITS